MKIRLGFVTNSSSSSFIIQQIGGKPGTIEEVYQDVRKLYTKMISKIDNMVEFAVQWGIIQPGQKAVDLYNKFNDEIYKPNMSNRFKQFESAFEKKFDANIFDINISHYDLSWMKCKTYTEYIAYFKSLNNAPFIIIDHININTNSNEFNHVIEAVAWYKYDDIMGYSGLSKAEYNKRIRDVAVQMGAYGIYSDCGNIPALVVNDLIDLSEFNCNHMG